MKIKIEKEMDYDFIIKNYSPKQLSLILSIDKYFYKFNIDLINELERVFIVNEYYEYACVTRDFKLKYIAE